ncbi:MAG: universal stress protein [Armatimonadota bacterium]|nr:universal stress protein [Armatimonadota bacterium]
MIIQTKGDVIRLRGSLAENQWPAIKAAVSLLLADHPGGVIIDASGLTDISEAGAHTFMDASNFIQAQSARVIVCGFSEPILAEIRRIPGVRSQLVLASTIDEARASLEAGGAATAVAGTKPAILVPLLGAWRKALAFAASEAVARRAEAHLLYVLQVPRNLPLGAPMPEQEQEAQHNLAEAEKALRRRGVTVRKRTTRARDVVEGAARFAADTKPDLVILAYFKEEMSQEGSRYEVMGTFCHEAPCDVVFYCVNP